MKLKMTYENSNIELLNTSYCSQILERNNNISRDINGDVTFIDKNEKYTSTIEGVGEMPEIDQSKTFNVECETRIYTNIKDASQCTLKHNAVPQSMFFKPIEGEINPINSLEDIKGFGEGELTYRPVFKMVVKKTTFKTENFKSKWAIHLEEI